MSKFQKEQQSHVEFLKKQKEEFMASVKKEKTVPDSKVNTAHKLPFANDGSFLERFKAMQQGIQATSSSPKAKTKIAIKPLKPTKPNPELKKPASIFSTDNEEGMIHTLGDIFRKVFYTTMHFICTSVKAPLKFLFSE